MFPFPSTFISLSLKFFIYCDMNTLHEICLLKFLSVQYIIADNQYNVEYQISRVYPPCVSEKQLMPVDHTEEKYIQHIYSNFIEKKNSNFHVPYIELEESPFSFTTPSQTSSLSFSRLGSAL